MSDEKQPQSDSDIIWKGSTILLTIILALALVSWVGDRRSLTAQGAHAGGDHSTESAESETDEDATRALAAEADEVRAELEKARVDNQALKQRVESLNDQLAAVGGEQGKLDERIASASQEKSALTEQLASVRAALAKAEAGSRAARADLIRIEEHRDSLLREKKRWDSSAKNADSDLNAKLTKYNDQLTAVRAEKAKETALLESKLNTEAKKVSALEEELKKAKANANRLSGVVDAKREQLEETLRELAEVEADRDELMAAKKRIVDLEKTIQSQEVKTAKVEALSRKNATAYEAQIKDLKKAVSQAGKSKNAESSTRIRDLRARLDAETRVANRLRTELQDMRAKATKLSDELALTRSAVAKPEGNTKPAPIRVVVDDSTDLIRANKVLTSQVKKANAEIRRVNIDREALIEEYKRSSDRIRKQMRKIQELETKLSKIN